MGREFNLVVFGCTGFTGKQVCQILAETYGLPSDQFKYAIAGRDEDRMDGVEEMMLKKAKGAKPGSSIPKILADVEDEASLVSMAKRTECLLALVAPSTDVGEPVVKACAENGTHYVGISGEVAWLQRMHEVYNVKAVASKAKIMPCCGGISFMPVESLFIHIADLCKQQNAQLVELREYIGMTIAGASGGTLRSLVSMCQGVSFMSLLRRQFNPYNLCTQLPSDATISANETPFRMEYLKSEKLWVTPSFVGHGMSAYLRWCNEVSNYGWGKDVVIHIYQLSNGRATALLNYLTIYLMPVALTVVSRIPFVTKLFPRSGKATFCPEKAKKNNNHVTVLMEADTLHKTTKTPNQLHFKYYSPHESYYNTALSGLEAAMTAVFDQTPAVYGVVSASAALGRAILPRLEKHKVFITQIRHLSTAPPTIPDNHKVTTTKPVISFQSCYNHTAKLSSLSFPSIRPLSTYRNIMAAPSPYWTRSVGLLPSTFISTSKNILSSSIGRAGLRRALL